MSDGRSDDEKDPGENGQADGQSAIDERTVEATVESGQSTGGQSTGGQSTGGQSSADGQSGGQPSGGQSSGQASGQSTGQTGGQSAGQTGRQDAGQTSGQSAGQSGGQAGGQSPGQTGGQSAGQPDRRNTGQSAGSAGRGVQPSDSMTGPAAGGTDLEPNVAAAIAYVFAPLTGVLMLLIEGDEDDFVRFHSIQSIGFGAAVIGAYVAVGVVMGVLTAIPVVGDIFAILVFPLNGIVALIAFVGWALLILKAYQGERYGLPVLGPIAASN
ncbi:DUF4870 domain-containing protein [Halosimplex sp. TS25]|uniref:DUF4870 domain-containing protein n=1 Tax=Halosimplex rarum TaxID=3396619 RepID=UPI0039EC5FF2